MPFSFRCLSSWKRAVPVDPILPITTSSFLVVVCTQLYVLDRAYPSKNFTGSEFQRHWQERLSSGSIRMLMKTLDWLEAQLSCN